MDHPVFTQPSDPDCRIWRYMDADRFRWLLEHRRLFMPSAQWLGDPAEGSTPPGELKWWQRLAAEGKTEEHRRAIERNRAFISEMARNWRPHYYVTCWHMNPYENNAMWGCYTKGVDAVAIATTYAKLEKSLPPVVYRGIVKYIDYATERMPTLNMLEYIMHKDIFYEFESEARAVFFPLFTQEAISGGHYNDNMFEVDGRPGFYAYAPPIDVRDLVEGVVLHPMATQPFEAEMTAICSSAGLPVPQRSRRLSRPVF